MGVVAEGSPRKVDAIKTQLVTLLETIKKPIPGLLNVHKSRPPVDRMDDFIKQFRENAPGGGKMINAWMLEPPSAVTDPTVQAGRTVKNWVFPVIGYMSVSDKENQHGIDISSIMDELLEEIEIVLMQDEVGFTINGTVINVRQVRMNQAPPAFFGQVLTYIANGEIDVITRTQY